MTLSFSTEINGEPNLFIEKIWEGLLPVLPFSSKMYLDYAQQHIDKFCIEWDGLDMERVWHEPVRPKRHTIRADKKDRWGKGSLIHPVINNRTPKRFQFAPVLECKSVQRVDITDISHLPKQENIGVVIKCPVNGDIYQLYWSVKIDGIELDADQIIKLAINDGFDSVDGFFDYFKNGIQNGKLIHWTDLKY